MTAIPRTDTSRLPEELVRFGTHPAADIRRTQNGERLP